MSAPVTGQDAPYCDSCNHCYPHKDKTRSLWTLLCVGRYAEEGRKGFSEFSGPIGELPHLFGTAHYELKVIFNYRTEITAKAVDLSANTFE